MHQKGNWGPRKWSDPLEVCEEGLTETPAEARATPGEVLGKQAWRSVSFSFSFPLLSQAVGFRTQWYSTWAALGISESCFSWMLPCSSWWWCRSAGGTARGATGPCARRSCGTCAVWSAWPSCWAWRGVLLSLPGDPCRSLSCTSSPSSTHYKVR